MDWKPIFKYHTSGTSIMVQNVPCPDVVLHVSDGKVSTVRSIQHGWISSSLSSVLVFCTKWKLKWSRIVTEDSATVTELWTWWACNSTIWWRDTILSMFVVTVFSSGFLMCWITLPVALWFWKFKEKKKEVITKLSDVHRNALFPTPCVH